jgi:hypothetical protein
MPHPLKIVVGGYIVGYPLGGMTWHHLNYLLGLQSLGHEVWFLEDSGSYSVPYNPTIQQCNPDPAYGLNYLKNTFESVGIPLQYCYYSQFWDTHYGLGRDELADLLRQADLLLCISGVTPLRDDRPRPRRTAVIDTDPVFTQLRMRDNEEFHRYYQSFDAIATFGTLVGTPGCPLPTGGLNWIPTIQPIALDHWPVVPTDSRRFTTIGKWEHGGRDVEFAGQRYRSSKEPQWRNMIDLPRRVPWQMEAAMQSMPQDVQAQFESRGWSLADPEPISISPAAFRQYIQHSAGEFTVAKEIYTALPSGWFSDRAACYLASGRPVVTQPSGFESWLPTGQGLFACQTPDQAADALNQIAQDYPAHSQAARRLAETHFHAKKVLAELIERIM